MPEITLPHAYTPWEYQFPLWEAFDSGKKRILLVWHRRAGKDKACFNLMVRETQRRVGVYYYFLPSFAQARRVIWKGIDNDGFRFINHAPRELWSKIHESDMRIEFKNGSLLQLVGSDNIDNIVGTNPVGCVFSEYSIQDPSGWEFIRPILRANGGWAIFNGTPRGKNNHLYKMLQAAKNATSGEWWTQVLTITETGVVDEAGIQAERESGMSEQMIQQEFYCDFEGSAEGSFYGLTMSEIEQKGHVTHVPHDAAYRVDTAWDIGRADPTCIVFFQQLKGGAIHVIDFFQERNQTVDYFVRVLQDKADELGYLYGEHIGPWDIDIVRPGFDLSFRDQFERLGFAFKRFAHGVKKPPLQDGIMATRAMIHKCYFDKVRCDRLTSALYAYSHRWDTRNKIWLADPKHDWASHPADAMRTMATGKQNPTKAERVEDRYTRAMRKQRGPYRRKQRSWQAA